MSLIVVFVIAIACGIVGVACLIGAKGKQGALFFGILLLVCAIWMLIGTILQFGKGIEVDSQIGVKVGRSLIRWPDFIEASWVKGETYHSSKTAIIAPIVGDKLTPKVIRIRYKDQKGKEKSLDIGGVQRAKEAVELMNECAQKYSTDK
jgi:hypothetical protein